MAILKKFVRCSECGYVSAMSEYHGVNLEANMHKGYHRNFSKTRLKYGITNVYLYSEYKEKKDRLESILSDKNSVLVPDEDLLNLMYKVFYNESMRVWDYGRHHPMFEDYIILLWNTKSFIDFVESKISKAVFDESLEKYMANRSMRAAPIPGLCFIFTGVRKKDMTGYVNYSDLSRVDKIKGEYY